MFGLRVYNEQGGIILDASDFTYEVIFNDVLDWSNVASNVTTSYTIPGFDQATCVFCVFHENPGAYSPTSDIGDPPLPYIYPPTGNTITLRSSTPGNTGSPSLADGVFRLIAFRMM